MGCGQGRTILQAEEEGAKSCLSIDADIGLLKKQGGEFWGITAQVRLEEKHTLRGDACKDLREDVIPEDSCADAVICSFVFPYVKDKLSFLQGIIRILPREDAHIS